MIYEIKKYRTFFNLQQGVCMDLQLGDVRDTTMALERVAFAYGEGRVDLEEARGYAHEIRVHIAVTEDLRRRPGLRAELRQLLTLLRMTDTQEGRVA